MRDLIWVGTGLLRCQPAPEWVEEIPTMDGFPQNVRGLDCMALPMTAPPEEETLIGYFSWHGRIGDEDDEAIVGCRNDHLVLPNGGAKIVSRWGMGTETMEKIFAPGEWELEEPQHMEYGSIGGQWIRKKI